MDSRVTSSNLSPLDSTRVTNTCNGNNNTSILSITSSLSCRYCENVDRVTSWDTLFACDDTQLHGSDMFTSKPQTIVLEPWRYLSNRLIAKTSHLSSLSDGHSRKQKWMTNWSELCPMCPMIVRFVPVVSRGVTVVPMDFLPWTLTYIATNV